MASERKVFRTTDQFEDATCIIRVLSAVLTQLIDINQKSNTRQHFVTKFQSSYAPNITIQAYLERISKYAKCSPNCFIVALIYIDRLIEIRNIVLTSLNVHRILITSILLSTKVFDDEFYKNAYYAKLGGVSTSEMNTLEVEFLSLVNFNLYVSIETFEKYQQELQSFLVGSSMPSSVSLPASEPLDSSQMRKGGEVVPSTPRVHVPELGDRVQDADPNSISPLRQFDVNNITALRSLLVNPHAQQLSAFPSQISTSSLFAPEDTSHSNAWPSAMPSNAVPNFTSVSSYDSPRSLASYPSTHLSPTTTTSTAICQKPNGSHFPGDAESVLMHHFPTPQQMPRSNLSHTLTTPRSAADVQYCSGPSVSVQQKYSSRQRASAHINPSPTAVIQPQQQNPRAVFPYQARYPPPPSGSYDTTGSTHPQHYDASGNGYNPPPQQAHFPHSALTYHPNCGGYFPNQNPTQLPFCPVPCKSYGANQMVFAGLSYPPPAPPMQYMTGGYYYHQPMPSQQVPAPRYHAPSSTPNSVADMFGPNKNEGPPPHYPSSFPQPDDFMQRANPYHPYPISAGVGGMQYQHQHQQQYYPWNEQQDLIGCANGNVPHFQHHLSGISTSDANSYPATALFYPMPLRTVS
jgi:hypothetical protein